MADKRREIYRSSNGDAWFLMRDASGRVFVEHEPNEPSGGQLSRLTVGAFLARGAAGPSTRRLIISLASSWMMPQPHPQKPRRHDAGARYIFRAAVSTAGIHCTHLKA